MGPRVSKAKGTKQYAGKIAVYSANFLSAAISAAAPAALADLARYDSARVSTTVASQVKHLPPSHGIRVTPSGRFPSDLRRPDLTRLSCRRETGFDKATPSDVIYESVPSSSTVSKAT